MTTRLRMVTPVTAVLAGGALVALDWDDPRFSTARLALVVAVGLLMAAAGVVARVNGEERLGDLVALAGAAWLVERALRAIPNGLSGTVGALLTGLWLAILVHAVVSFPSGRAASGLERAVVGAGYAVNVGLNLPYLVVGPSLAIVGVMERNVFLVDANPDAARWIGEASQWLTVGWAAVVLGLIAAKVRAASPPARRAYAFVWVSGALLAVNVMVLIAAAEGVFAFRDAYGLWLEIVAGLVPVTLAASLFAARVAEDRLVALVVDRGTAGSGDGLRDALRRALADPTLEVVYRRSGGEDWISGLGLPAATPGAVADRAFTPVDAAGGPIAGLIHDPVLLRNPERLRAATGATALAIENERLKADLRAQLLDVQASRRRIVEVGDRERRRVERNLHDGAQQRLVGLALTLRMAGREAEGDPAVAALLTEAAGQLDDALDELREVARGIHPAILTDAGLVGALEMLAERPGVPVELAVDLPGRLPEPVEVGAYYLVAEALTNANKHASASCVSVRATVVDETLRISVSDDGRGAAAARPGSGLEGLADRVGSLAGHLVVESPAGRGTTVTAHLPLRSPAPPDRERPRAVAHE